MVEVGLGGRLDATNVLPHPRAAAITRIALTATPDRLGTTLVEIAREKAGIAKVGMDIVLGDVPPEVRAAIDEEVLARGATTSTAEDVEEALARGPRGRAPAAQRTDRGAARAADRVVDGGHRGGARGRTVAPGGSSASTTCCSTQRITPTAPRRSLGTSAVCRSHRTAWPSCSEPSPRRTGRGCWTPSPPLAPPRAGSTSPPSGVSRPALDPSQASSRHAGSPAPSIEGRPRARAQAGRPRLSSWPARSSSSVPRARAPVRSTDGPSGGALIRLQASGCRVQKKRPLPRKARARRLWPRALSGTRSPRPHAELFDVVSKVQMNEVDKQLTTRRRKSSRSVRLQGHRDVARQDSGGHHDPVEQR